LCLNCARDVIDLTSNVQLLELNVARIEVSGDELARLLQSEVKEVILRRFRQAGFTYVAVDLQGFRSGSMNETTVEARKIVQLRSGSS